MSWIHGTYSWGIKGLEKTAIYLWIKTTPNTGGVHGAWVDPHF